MSLFGGMIVKDEPEPPPAQEETSSGSAFSFMNKSTPANINDSTSTPDEDEPSAFSFMKKGSSASLKSQEAKTEDTDDKEGSAFSFMKKKPSTPMSSASVETAPALVPDVSQQIPTYVPKKKKKTGIRPGHAREEVMGHMQSRHEMRSATVSHPAADTTPTTTPRTSAASPATDSKPSPKIESTKVVPVENDTSASSAVSENEPARKPQTLSSSAPQLDEKRSRTGSFGRKSAAPQPARQESKATSIGSKMSSFFGLGKKGKGKPAATISERKADPTVAAPVVRPTRAMESTAREVTKPASTPPPKSMTESTPSPRVEASPTKANTVRQQPRDSPEQNVKAASPAKRSLKKQKPSAADADSAPAVNDIAAESNNNTSSKQTVTVDESESVSQKSMRTVAFAGELANEIEGKFAELDAQQNEVMEAASAALQESVSQRQELKSKLKQQEEALNMEDYDLAEALEKQVDALKLALDAESQVSDTSSLRDSLMDILNAKRTMWNEEITLHQSTVEELRNSIHAQEEEVKGFEWELDAATADERADLEARQTKLKKMKAHLELDRSGLEEQAEQYRKKADAKTAAFVKEKNRLTQSRSKVSEKIADLRQELRRLEQEEEDLSKSISVQDERIAQAESGLSSEKKAMDEEAHALDEREAELVNEEQNLELAKARLAENEADFRGQHEDLEISLKQARDHITFAIKRKHELSLLDKAMEEYLEANDCMFDPNALLADGTNSEVAVLRKGVAEISAKVQELTKLVLDKQATSSSLRKQLEDIDDRIPELERAKKLAVSGRNFKEASKINNEIKELAATKDERRTELEELNGRLLTQTEALDEAKDEYATLQEKLKSSEADFDTSTFEELKVKSQEFRDQILQYARTNPQIAQIAKSNAKTCELMLSQLSIKHDIDWNPNQESLDGLMERAVSTRGPDGEELLVLLDVDAPTDLTADTLVPDSAYLTPDGDVTAVDLLGLDVTESSTDDIVGDGETDGTDNGDVDDDEGELETPAEEIDPEAEIEEIAAEIEANSGGAENEEPPEDVDDETEVVTNDDTDMSSEATTKPEDTDGDAAVIDEDEDEDGIDDKCKAAAQIKILEDSIAKLENEMDEAAAAEEFELAEELQLKVTDLKTELASLNESSA